MVGFHPIPGLDNYLISTSGEVYSLLRRRVVSPQIDHNGYWRVRLTLTTSVRKAFMVHVLLAKTFIPNPDPSTKTRVNHKDGLKANLALSNLEWVTDAENQQHALSTGLKPSSSPYYGVTFNQSDRGKKWRAQVWHNNKMKLIGRYGTAEEAAGAYNNYVVSNSLSKLLNKLPV